MAAPLKSLFSSILLSGGNTNEKRIYVRNYIGRHHDSRCSKNTYRKKGDEIF